MCISLIFFFPHRKLRCEGISYSTSPSVKSGEIAVDCEMQAFRKFSPKSAVLRAASYQKPAAIQVSNCWNTNEEGFRARKFADDEYTGPKDDEFFRTADQIRQRKQMRANFERIKSLPDQAYEKHVLREMLYGNYLAYFLLFLFVDVIVYAFTVDRH